jgi:hypothetical protein
MSDGYGQALMARNLGVFAVALIAGQVALMAVGYFFPNFDFGNSMGVVMVMLAAMLAGQSHVRQSGQRPTGGEKLVFMVLATLVLAVVALVLAWGIFQYYGVPLTMENVILSASGDARMAADVKDILPIALGIEAVLTLFLSWLGFGLGARSQIKQAERLAAKAAKRG